MQKMRQRSATILVLASWIMSSFAFSPILRKHILKQAFCRSSRELETCLRESVENKIEPTVVAPSTLEMAVLEAYPNCQIFTFELPKHRPLGCTVEESFDTQSDPSITLVTKVVKGGNADMAGIQVGDVLIGVTGIFREMTPVFQSGVEKIKGFVGSVAEDETLVLQFARGTGVLQRHEAAIVELCQSPGVSDKEVENCVVDFLAAGYDSSFDGTDSEEEEECNLDDEAAECMLDNMMNSWIDEIPLPPTTSGITDARKDDKPSKPKPWSSRSSPSGTFVRDPVTGEMRNIDA